MVLKASLQRFPSIKNKGRTTHVQRLLPLRKYKTIFVYFGRELVNLIVQIGKEVARRTVQEIVDDILWNFEQHTIAVWSPVVRARKGTHAELFKQFVEQGYMNGRVNGHDADFENPPTLDKNFRHDIDVRIDRFVLSKTVDIEPLRQLKTLSDLVEVH